MSAFAWVAQQHMNKLAEQSLIDTHPAYVQQKKIPLDFLPDEGEFTPDFLAEAAAAMEASSAMPSSSSDDDGQPSSLSGAGTSSDDLRSTTPPSSAKLCWTCCDTRSAARSACAE